MRVYCFNLTTPPIRHQFPGIIFRQRLEILPLQLPPPPFCLISRLTFSLFKKLGKEITMGRITLRIMQQQRRILLCGPTSRLSTQVYTHSWIRSGSVSSLQAKNLEYFITNKHLERRKTNYSIGILPICGTWCIPVSDSVSFVGSVLVYFIHFIHKKMRKNPWKIFFPPET